MHRLRSATATIIAAALLSITFPGGVASGDPAGAVVDTFARADSSTLGLTETAQPWTMWSGSAGVVSQQAELSGSGYTLAVVDTGLTAATAAVSVPVVSPEYWLIVRAGDAANYWRFGRWQGGAYQLQQVVNNNLGSPALELLATVTPAAGDRVSCELGSALTCAVNGTAVVRTTDAFNSGARSAGLAGYTGSGGPPVRFDDLLVQAPAPPPDLVVDVTAGSATATTGAPVSWTATVSNAGPAGSTATAVTATVTPPAGLSGVAVSTSAGSCSPAASVWTCSLGDRSAGTTATITVTATAPPEPAALVLGVNASAQEADANPADNADEATITVTSPTTTTAPTTTTTTTAPPPPPPAQPDLRVAVAAASATVDTGATALWTATVTNVGTVDATGATVVITPPAGLASQSAASSAGSCAPAGGSWTCTLGTRPPSSAVTITLAGTAPGQPATLALTATAASGQPDAVPADNSAAATVSAVAPQPGATVVTDGFNRANATKLGKAETGQTWTLWAGWARISSKQALVGELGYGLVVVDSGTATGTAAVTMATISDEYWLVVRGTDGGNYWRFGRSQGGAYRLQQVVGGTAGTPAVTTLGTVTPASGDRLSCTSYPAVTCSVNGTAVVRSTDTFNATARFTGLAAGAATRFDDVSVIEPAAAPDLRVTAAPAATSVPNGAPVSWTATIANSGTATSASTVVAVTPPAGLTGTAVTPSAGRCLPGSTAWTCDVGSLAVGGSVTVSVAGSAPSTGTGITLAVGAGSNRTDLDPSTDATTSAVTLTPPPPPVALLRDGFGRADSSSLGVADTGQAWSTWLGTTRIAGQQAEATGAAYTMAVADAGATSGTVAVTVPVVSNEFWLVARATDDTNYWRFGRWQGGPYLLQQVIGNTLGPAAVTASATVTPAAGDHLSCKLGTGLACSVNGTLVASTTDGFNATGRVAGFAAGSGAPARFDDVSVTAPADGPDLVVSVAVGSSTVDAGAPVSWTATVRNDGTRTASGTVVTVTPPSGLLGSGVSSTAGSCVFLVTTWRCSAGDRAAGSSFAVTLNATAPDQNATLTASFSASAEEADADPASNTAGASIVVRAPLAPGLVVTDGFDRPDAPALGQADTGQLWSTVAGSFGISAGAAAPGGSGTNVALVDPGWQFGTYQVTVKAGAAPGAFAVVVRGRDANNSVRIGPDSSGFYRMWKVVGGSVQPLAISLRRADLAPRDGDVIRVVNRPDDGLFVSVNGQHLLDAGDQAMLSEPRFGLVASSTAVRFDSVWISQAMSSGVTTVDTFSSADGPLADRQTETGTHYGWHCSYGWAIQSGRAVTPGYGLSWVDTTSELADASVQIRSGPAEAFLVFRRAENGDYYRFGHQTGGSYAVEKVTGGTSSTTVATTTLAPQAIDTVAVRQFTDGRVEGHVNGVVVVSFTDTTFSIRATGYGIEGNAATFDDFTVTAK